jgi:hypothetical protein
MGQISVHPIASAVLGLGVLTFGFFGVLFLVAFDRVIARLGISADPTGRVDLVATYAGFELGFAGFLAMCALRDGWLHVGLVASGFAFAGFGAGRAYALARNRGAATFLWYLLAAEAVGAALSFSAASRVA